MKKNKSKAGSCILKTFLTVLIIVLLFAIINVLVVPGIAYLKDENPASYDGMTNPHIHYGDRTYISAHRAGGDLAPEETLKAFELCMTGDYTVDIVEFDLHITKDGKLVLLHDETINRTSNATEVYGKDKVYAKDLTLEELKALNFGENFVDPDGNTPYKGLRGDDIPDDVKIVSLNEILDYLTSVNKDLQYVIEIKDDKQDGYNAMDILHQTMIEYDILDKTIVGTFHNKITKYIDEKYPDVIRSASIAEVLEFYVNYIYGSKAQHTYKFKFDVLQIPTGTFIWDFGSASFINYAHKRNIAVQYWTINDVEEAERLRSNGADCVMTDNPKAVYDQFNGANKN